MITQDRKPPSFFKWIFIRYAMASWLLTFFERSLMYRADSQAILKPIDPAASLEADI